MSPGAVPAVTAVRDVRWELATALRFFGAQGWEFGFNGHVSARVPEDPDLYWVNPFGVSIRSITPQDLVLVDGDGAVVEPRNSHRINGFTGNLTLHQQVPEAAVAIHLHTPRGFAWSALGRPLLPVTTDSALITRLQGLTARNVGVSTDPTPVELVQRGARVLLRRNHGFWTVGGSVAEAAFYLCAAERAAEANLALLGVDGIHLLDEHWERHWTLTPEVAAGHFENVLTDAEAHAR
ncbi:class II aldolase/adducin family protein [Nakamurella leprariae]|uniref:Class II aldolase/adducin family protein n=1 Tax=Nakamurella leprariae TaxID=2803911 RepID=A0A939C001_9ACTN|nr:class II aldolase/adducin family protein [Nakamurella leprariae]MBM9465672.1 class II aldolase/adducin family protein [Nakamurella leprariae]